MWGGCDCPGDRAMRAAGAQCTCHKRAAAGDPDSPRKLAAWLVAERTHTGLHFLHTNGIDIYMQHPRKQSSWGIPDSQMLFLRSPFFNILISYEIFIFNFLSCKLSSCQHADTKQRESRYASHSGLTTWETTGEIRKSMNLVSSPGSTDCRFPCLRWIKKLKPIQVPQ